MRTERGRDVVLKTAEVSSPLPHMAYISNKSHRALGLNKGVVVVANRGLNQGILRAEVHAAIENVGLKEVWLKIAGGEKA